MLEWQRVQTLIRLLLLEQSDLALHCLNKAYLQTFRVNNGIIFHILNYVYSGGWVKKTENLVRSRGRENQEEKIKSRRHLDFVLLSLDIAWLCKQCRHRPAGATRTVKSWSVRLWKQRRFRPGRENQEQTTLRHCAVEPGYCFTL